MEKALRILDDAVKSLESEIRVWKRQGNAGIVEKCREDLKQVNEGIRILSESQKAQIEVSNCNITQVINCPICGGETHQICYKCTNDLCSPLKLD